MKHSTIVFFAFVCLGTIQAQIRFERAYFIDNQEKKRSAGSKMPIGATIQIHLCIYFRKMSAVPRLRSKMYEDKDLLRLYPFLESDLSKVGLVLGWKVW